MEKEFSVMESPIVYEISSCVRQRMEKHLEALPDKEYGGNPRIMMCLDIYCLKNSWQSLSATVTDAERREIVKDYPYTMIDDGTEYFSRLKDERRRFRK